MTGSTVDAALGGEMRVSRLPGLVLRWEAVRGARTVGDEEGNGAGQERGHSSLTPSVLRRAWA